MKGLAGTAVEYVSTNIWDTIPQLSKSSMQNAFQYCKNLAFVEINTGYVSSFASAFLGCTNLATVNLTSPELNLTGLTNSFMSCYNLTNVNLSFNNSLTSMTNTFRECNNLTKINFNNSFSQTNTVSMYYTFYNDMNLVSFKANIPMGPNALVQTFQNCINLKEVYFNSDEIWSNTCTNMLYAFYNCSNLETIDNTYDISININNTFGGIFYNCRKLNISNFIMNVDSKGNEVSSMANVLTNNPFVTSINLDLNTKLTNSYYGTNTVDLFYNCQNVQYANINILDASTHSNTWYVSSILTNATNVQNLNLNLWTNGRRSVSGDPITGCVVDNFNYTIGRSSSYNNIIGINVYNCKVNNFIGNLDAQVGCVYLRYCNFKNANITFTNMHTLSTFSISESNWGTNVININYPTIENCTTLLISNVQNITDLNMNLANVGASGDMNIKPRLNVNYCQQLTNLNVDLSNTRNLYSLNFRECPNLTNININLSNVTRVDYSLYIYNLLNCTNLNLYMPNMVSLNYSFGIHDCPKLTTLNFGFGKNMTNIYEFQFSNLRNLQTIKMDYPNMKNIYVTAYIRFNNCPNLSDQTIDNLFGMLSNLSHLGTKYINYSFRNCNLSQERAQNLANYNNLISAGWTY